jgi:hypothetical protein
MGEQVGVDFPAVWRQNVIEVKREERRRPTDWEQPGEILMLEVPEWLRTRQALWELADRGTTEGFAEDDLLAALHSVAGHPALNLILETCVKHQVTLEQLLDEAHAYEPG